MAIAAASTDGLHVAIARDRELVLYTVEPFALVARVELAAVAVRGLAFAGRHVVVHHEAAFTTYSISGLVRTATVELATPMRLVATSDPYAAFVATDGALAIARCRGEGSLVAPVRVPTTAAHVVGLDGARFLVWNPQGAGEEWDAAKRVPTARIGLELSPDTTAVGTTGKHRSVWIATASGDLITSRLSDGKTLVAPLPKPAQRIASHPASAWLVMDFAGEPHAVNTLAIPRECARVVAPSVGSSAFVIVDEGERAERYPIGL